jgi:AcrR family transcriptional regulator
MIDAKENKKDQILNAASRVFAKYGFHKTTLDDIGDQVGMKKNSLYHYFSNKEEIFFEIIKLDAEEYFTKMEIELSVENNASDKLKKFVLFSSEFWKKRANFYSLVTSVRVELVNRISDYYEEALKQQKLLINNVLAEGIIQNEFINHDTVQLADDLIDMLVSIEHWEYRKYRQSFPDEDYFNENKRKKIDLLNFIIRGLQIK